MEVLNTEAELLQLRQQEAALHADVRRYESEMEAHREAFEKQYVLAEEPGRVHFLYNAKASADLFTKGEVLTEVVPATGSVYARMNVRQDQVREIAVGQLVHLKLDAYQYYRYGIVVGRVRYVSTPDNLNNFHVIVDVMAPNDGPELKPSYRIKAEVIQRRVPLYEFILKRLFGGGEPGQGAPRQVLQQAEQVTARISEPADCSWGTAMYVS